MTDDWFDIIAALLDEDARFLVVGAHAMVVQFGLPPNRIDLLTSLSGIDTFEEAWRDRIDRTLRGREVPFLGRTSLVATKRATGRTKDLADLEALGEG